MRCLCLSGFLVAMMTCLSSGDGFAAPLIVADKGDIGDEFPPVSTRDEDAVFVVGIRLIAGGGGGGVAGTPIRNGVIRVREINRVASYNSVGLYRFPIPAFGTYQIFATATGYRPYGPVVLTVQPASPFPLMTITLQPETDGSRDSDGDGLSDIDEIEIYGTDPFNPDTDGDGMSDLFEVEFGLDPFDPTDAAEDADGDLLTNLQEFRLGTNPRDPTDPQTIYYVSIRTGDDIRGDGSRDTPWQTINGALANLRQGNGRDGVVPSLTAPALLFLAPGVYSTESVLPDGVRLGAAPSGQAIIQGVIEGGRGAAFTNLRFVEVDDKSDDSDNTLLYLPHDGSLVEKCIFEGLESSDVSGIVFDGPEHGRSAVSDSRFERLKFGIEVLGDLPKIRRNLFDFIDDTGVVFRDDDKRGMKPEPEPERPVNSFGDVRDPGSGFNVFTNVVNRAVLNEREVTIPMQNNDWGIDDLAQAELIISGPALVPPIIQPQGSILASAIFVTVWDKVTRDRIETGSAKLIVSTYNPVTNNQDGVYPFPAVADGRYTIEVSAEGYEQDERTIDLAPGQVRSLSFPLSPEIVNGGEGEGIAEGEGEGAVEGEGEGLAEGEGEGEGEDIGGGAGCQCDNTAPPSAAQLKANGLTLGLTLGGMVFMRRRFTGAAIVVQRPAA